MREQIQTYLIPNNFIDESRVFNGAIRVRYLVEAIIIFVAIAGPCWLLIPSDTSAKLGITLGCSLPLTLLALTGINGDSLSDFLKSALSWKKYKQIMLYNENVRTYRARPVDVMLAETNPSDVLRNSLEKWKTQRSQQNANMDLVENVDFVFMEDKEYEKMTPQEIREKQKQKEKEAQRRKKAAKKLKKRKNKETFLLPAGQSDAESAEKLKTREPDKTDAQSEAENHTAVAPIQKNSDKESLDSESFSISLEKTPEPELLQEAPEEETSEFIIFEDETPVSELKQESEPESEELVFEFNEEEPPIMELTEDDAGEEQTFLIAFEDEEITENSSDSAPSESSESAPQTRSKRKRKRKHR